MVVVIDTEAASSDAQLRYFPVQDDLDDIVELYARLPQGLGQDFRLDLVAGKTVKQPAVFAVILPEPVKDHGDGDIIGNEISPVDILFGLLSEFGTAADILAENGAGLDMGHVVFFLDNSALGALAASVGSEYQDVHVLLLFAISVCQKHLTP
jgi:hypothetical protein